MEFVISTALIQQILVAIIFFYALLGFVLAKWGDPDGRTISFVIASGAQVVGMTCLFYPPLLNVVYTAVAIFCLVNVALALISMPHDNPSSKHARA